MAPLKRLFTLTGTLLFGLLAACGATGKTMKLTDFFTDDVVALVQAIEKGDETKARQLIAQGATLNLHGDEGITPLFWLLMQKDKPAMRLALKLGANPNLASPNGDTPVTLAAGGSDAEFLLILLEGGGDPNAVDRNGYPALFGAISQERPELMKMLIRFGADINLTNRSEENSVLHAASLNKYEIVHYLIEQGADYAARDSVRTNVPWEVHFKLSNNLLSPQYPAYGWALKVKQQLVDRGVVFPPLSPDEVREKERRGEKP